MTEWEIILSERKEDQQDQKNAKVINKLLEGRRTPTRAGVVREMTDKYSRYGKNDNGGILQQLRISKANDSEETEEEGERI